jgi:two-component system sensor histidine kinase YesM
MAVIQKNTGIANMTRSLVNLLRNIAKGTQDKITLGEEIQLLEDYIAIQSVRYVEVFEFINEVPEALLEIKIIKLTLQPLIENAIFHGIEPTGKYGII